MGRGGAGDGAGASKGRGELGELRNQLMALCGGGSGPERINQKRDLFRKIIMSGTIGQDMSGLFMQVKNWRSLGIYSSNLIPVP